MSLVFTIEGLDGTGKSTLAREVLKTLSADSAFYPWIYLTKEPGNEVHQNAIRLERPGPNLRSLVLGEPNLSPLERELLFYVDASLHSRFITNQGSALILSDRGLWSHLAYLRGYLKTGQVDWDQYQLCKKIIERVCHKPDAVIYLSGDLVLMQERLANKEKDAIEANDERFFSAVLETYEDLAAASEIALVLNARDSTRQNTMKVVEYLKGVFDEQELKSGNRGLH